MNSFGTVLRETDLRDIFGTSGRRGAHVKVSLSRNAQLVKYFAQQYRGVPRTRLVKFIYMADVLARQYLGAPVSQFRYIRHRFGPYDSAIEDAVRELEAAGLVEQKTDWWDVGKRSERVVDLHRPIPFDFSLGEGAVLDYVVTNYVGMPWKEFLHDVVYETPPMQGERPMGAPLPMSLLDDTGTRQAGFALAEVLIAENAARRGDVVTLSEFISELRAKAPA